MAEKPEKWTRETTKAYRIALEKERDAKMGRAKKKKLSFNKNELEKFKQGLTGTPARKGSK